MFKILWIGLILIAVLSACTFTQKVKTGVQAYEVKQYSVAAKLFEKEYELSNTQEEKAKLAFLAGESYRFLNDHGSAGNWYLNAYEDGYGEKALESYANSLKHQERYQEALKAYDDLLKLSPGNAAYRSYITVTKQAMEWSKNPNVAYKINSASFNSPNSDYSPQPIGPGQVLFTSDRESRQNTDTYLWTGRSFSDLFVTNPVSAQVIEFDASINSEENDGTAVLSPDGKALVFTRCYVKDAYDAWCKLMISFRKGNDWSEPEPLPFVKEKINYGQPAFAANGTTLFFSSDAPEGQGGHDIYFAQADGQGSWSEPVNLGTLVNTAGEELYPTVYKDTLYYSSDHLPGLGGLDIFKTYLDRTEQWISPINLRAPINSGSDDFGFVVDTFAKLESDVRMKGFFTTSRDGAGRNDEIYAFTLSEVVPDIDVTEANPKADTVPAIEYKVFLALRVVEPEFEIKGDPNSKVIKHKPLPNGPVILTKGKLDERFVTDQFGQLLLQLQWDNTYIVTARYRDHLTASLTINTNDVVRNPDKTITTVNEVLVLDPIFKDKEIVLENIFYDYDEWFIRDDAKPSLDKLLKIMKANPNIRVQLSSHTDCRGTDEYNLELSQKRAQAAIDYLITTGIAEKRLQAQGFGESNPAVKCECESCTEDNHQKNRRTTFKIID
ncbi:MAG TPA: OmpA family protein [Saprospiraceae bacterium]|nr:OmpA family protein [Saprospiraceae bacterium]